MNHLLRVLFLLTLVCGCEHQPTQAELERDVLKSTFRYYYDQDLSAEERTEAKVVFVGEPGNGEVPEGRPLIESLYRDLSPKWFAALESTGIPVRQASQAAFIPTKQNWFHDPKSGDRVVVFGVSKISFSSPNQATVVFSSAWAPLVGGERTYHLAREAGQWSVRDAGVTAIF